MDLKPHPQPCSSAGVLRLEPPAPFIYRALASILDILLAFVLISMLLKQVILPYYDGQAFSELKSIFYQSQQPIGAEGSAFAFTSLNQYPPEVQKLINYALGVSMLLLWVYFGVLDMLLHGKSLGKRVFRLKVVNSIHFKELNVFEYLVRSIIKGLCLTVIFPAVLLLNLLPALLSKRRQCGHDWISRSMVVEDNAEVNLLPDNEL